MKSDGALSSKFTSGVLLSGRTYVVTVLDDMSFATEESGVVSGAVTVNVKITSEDIYPVLGMFTVNHTRFVPPLGQITFLV